ncbi:MAG: hypothetical protein JWR05_2079 [Mucilaginibacter sp.]|nr:hypothetical protein [Mucilaginibacter sp.]
MKRLSLQSQNKGNGFNKADNHRSLKLLNWPVRLGVRTLDFHSRNRGSIPLRATKNKIKSCKLKTYGILCFNSDKYRTSKRFCCYIMKEQQSAGVLWESNPTADAVSPAKYHLPTTAFIF